MWLWQKIVQSIKVSQGDTFTWLFIFDHQSKTQRDSYYSDFQAELPA